MHAVTIVCAGQSKLTAASISGSVSLPLSRNCVPCALISAEKCLMQSVLRHCYIHGQDSSGDIISLASWGRSLLLTWIWLYFMTCGEACTSPAELVAVSLQKAMFQV